MKPVIHHEHRCLLFSLHESFKIRRIIADEMVGPFDVVTRMYQ